MSKHKPARDYPPGHFLAPVHAWKGMHFESQIHVDPKTKRFETDFARQQRIRESSGWNTRPMALVGSLKP